MEIIDVVQFQLSGTSYAIDIKTAREIVEMMPITPVPRAPPHIAGIINLRGEITNIMNLSRLMGLNSENQKEGQKIIVLVPEAAGGSIIGLIVDDVHSVLQVNQDDIDKMDASISKEAYVKGIIKTGASGDGKKDLVIWIDIEKLLLETLGSGEVVV